MAEYATVLVSRSPENDEELDICEGDFVKILQKFNNGWVKGSINGCTGLLPINHLKVHQHQFTVRVHYKYEAQLPDELSLEVDDLVNVLDDELEDEGWWLGEIGGQLGVLPCNFVEKIRSAPLNHAVFRKKNVSASGHERPREDAMGSAIVQNVSSGNVPKVKSHGFKHDSRSPHQGQKLSEAAVVAPPAAVSEEAVKSLREELARIRFGFEWFSMRHAKMVSQMVDDVEEGKKERKRLEMEVREVAAVHADVSLSGKLGEDAV